MPVLVSSSPSPAFSRPCPIWLNYCWKVRVNPSENYSFTVIVTQITRNYSDCLKRECIMFSRIYDRLLNKAFKILQRTSFNCQKRKKNPIVHHWNSKDWDWLAEATGADQDQASPWGAVWSGSTLFASPYAAFRHIPAFKHLTVQPLGQLWQIIQCPNN